MHDERAGDGGPGSDARRAGSTRSSWRSSIANKKIENWRQRWRPSTDKYEDHALASASALSINTYACVCSPTFVLGVEAEPIFHPLTPPPPYTHTHTHYRNFVLYLVFYCITIGGFDVNRLACMSRGSRRMVYIMSSLVTLLPFRGWKKVEGGHGGGRAESLV